MVKRTETGETPFLVLSYNLYVIFIYLNIINIISYICENHFSNASADSNISVRTCIVIYQHPTII